MNTVLMILRAAWKHPRLVLLAILTGVVVIGSWHVKRVIHDLRADRDSLRVVAANQAADLDTVRNERNDLAAHLLHQSDTVNHLRRLVATVRGTVDTVQKTDTLRGVPTLTAPVTLTATLDSAPTHVTATVTADSVSAIWSWQVALDPIPLGVDAHCAAPGRPELSIQHPPWLRIDSIAGVVNPNLCGTVEPIKPPSHAVRWMLIGAGGATLLIRALHHGK